MANPRISDPAASYTSTGNLLCTLCRLPVKSSSQWATHITTERHIKLSATPIPPSRRRKRSPDPEPASDPPNRKRARGPGPSPLSTITSASPTRPLATNGRLASRSKSTEQQSAWKTALHEAQAKSSLPDGFMAGVREEGEQMDRELMPPPAGPPAGKKARIMGPAGAPPLAEGKGSSIDEELLAFEKELEDLPADDEVVQAPEVQIEQMSTSLPSSRPAALEAEPQYSSGFVSTGGQETQPPAASIEESNFRKGELQNQEEEDEKEEREQKLRDEFDQMQELEERVRLLKERREALRRSREEVKMDPGGVEPDGAEAEAEVEAGSSSDDEVDGWGFR